MMTALMNIVGPFAIGFLGILYYSAHPKQFSKLVNYLLIGVDIMLIVSASYRLPISNVVWKAVIAAIAMLTPSIMITIWQRK
ncbi:hypothetical protein FD09_GL000810 [Schleiferilactobacillus perolens DSM 12744]|uniref:Uncharacterized protein n=2 Tax=Schleiferilactobacillus perolens TaxID=100468 RepID=A0A0R1N332_9LACO|nr:hypothetical protein FD09_GL000810 [Schleiferilactobacillus perolens DSM 12744]